MDKQMQEASAVLRGRLYRRDTSKPKEHRILVLKTGLAGIQYYIRDEADQKALDARKPGDELLLYREPDNKFDEWAVAIYRNESDQIGFLTRFKNETIARLMDAGKQFVAVVDDPAELEQDTYAEPRYRRAYTENMGLPFSVYLVEQDGV
ncbi:MAG: HIRAN domain-containing protein [Oscillospiraceae bacterium]|nr:HIRAN domain-containing protein [Oscillospiraceae bacterium]